MSNVVVVAGGVLIAVGAVLSVIAAVGVLRLPDVLLRMNAATKASSLGVVCILAGVVLLDFSVRALLTLGAGAVLLLVTAPVAGHVVGHAAYRSGLTLWPGTRRDDVAPDAPPDG